MTATAVHYPRAFTEYDALAVASRDKRWDANERAALTVLADDCPLGSRREDGARIFAHDGCTFAVVRGRFAGQVVTRVAEG